MERKGIYRTPKEDSFISKEDINKATVWRQFPDKKRMSLDPIEVEAAIDAVQRIKRKAEVGQKEATWIPELEVADRPLLFLFLTDPHYSSLGVDHKLLNQYLDVVMNTPNMYIVTGGDDVDNFNVNLGRISDGMYNNPFDPGIQARAWRRKMKKLDDKGKIGAMCFGNHTDWFNSNGADWYDTYLGQFDCPIFTSGGKLRVMFHGGAKYEIAMTHKHWGTSKLNPTNACKRFMEHDHPSADVILLGHTHQSEVLHFERGGKERLAIIGGTYKQYDTWARKMGIGGHPGQPGICVALWPKHQEFQGYKKFDRAVKEHVRRL